MWLARVTRANLGAWEVFISGEWEQTVVEVSWCPKGSSIRSTSWQKTSLEAISIYCSEAPIPAWACKHSVVPKLGSLYLWVRTYHDLFLSVCVMLRRLWSSSLYENLISWVPTRSNPCLGYEDIAQYPCLRLNLCIDVQNGGGTCWVFSWTWRVNMNL